MKIKFNPIFRIVIVIFGLFIVSCAENYALSISIATIECIFLLLMPMMEQDYGLTIKLVDDWTQHGAIYKSGKIKLEAKKKYPIKLEYNELIGGASISLLWITPSQMIENNKLAAQFNPNIVKNRSVYLPEAKGWFDFWNGKSFAGGQTIQVPAPIDIMPLFVKAGSIVPMGPFLQYTTEKPADPLEIRIYPGASGSFVLYEDENDNYNYEKGIYSTITFSWIDNEKKLEISNRKGDFPGILKNRTFNIVLVKENQGNGLDVCPKPDKTITYEGKKQIINF